MYALEGYDELPMGVEDRTECEEEGIKQILKYAAKRELKILKNEGKAKLKATKIGQTLINNILF